MYGKFNVNMGADFYFIGYLMGQRAILTPLFSGSLEFCFFFQSDG